MLFVQCFPLAHIWRVDTNNAVILLSFQDAVDCFDVFARLARYNEHFPSAVISRIVKMPDDCWQPLFSPYEGGNGLRGAYADAIESGKRVSVYLFGTGC